MKHYQHISHIHAILGVARTPTFKLSNNVRHVKTHVYIIYISRDSQRSMQYS